MTLASDLTDSDPETSRLPFLVLLLVLISLAVCWLSVLARGYAMLKRRLGQFYSTVPSEWSDAADQTNQVDEKAASVATDTLTPPSEPPALHSCSAPVPPMAMAMQGMHPTAAPTTDGAAAPRLEHPPAALPSHSEGDPGKWSAPAPDGGSSRSLVPSQLVPAQPMLAQPTPSHPTPAQPMPAQPMPAQPMLAQPMLAQPTPSQPMPAQPMLAQPMPARLMPAQLVPVQQYTNGGSTTLVPTQLHMPAQQYANALHAFGQSQQPSASAEVLVVALTRYAGETLGLDLALDEYQGCWLVRDIHPGSVAHRSGWQALLGATVVTINNHWLTPYDDPVCLLPPSVSMVELGVLRATVGMHAGHA